MRFTFGDTGAVTGAWLFAALPLAPVAAHEQQLPALASPATPLTIGERFTLPPTVRGETRRINVYAPPEYVASTDARLPVLDRLKQHAPASLTWHCELLAAETHATLYHPAALNALRHLFAPR